jgi:acyl dehydratase
VALTPASLYGGFKQVPEQPTGSDRIEHIIGPHGVDTDETSVRRFSTALGTRSTKSIPHTFPISWLGQDVWTMLSRQSRAMLQVGQSIRYRNPLTLNRRYVFSLRVITGEQRKTTKLSATADDGNQLRILEMDGEVVIDAAIRSKGMIPPFSEDLPLINFPAITAAQVHRYAEASGDYNPIHFDTAEAQAIGAESCIVQGMLIIGQFETALRQWLPDATLISTATRFIHPLLVDLPFTIAGRWAAQPSRNAKSIVRLLVRDTRGRAICVCDAGLGPPESADHSS